MKRILLAVAMGLFALGAQAKGGGAGGHASASAHSSVSAHAAESAHVSPSEAVHVNEALALHVPTRSVTTTTYPWWLFGHAYTSTSQVSCDPKKNKDCH
ncbi:hypothetical protein C7410_115188 [Paraburkholderia silvatlantica]|uniref:Uncharacterized protein n=1 Tax=Paraburkholderia silvatlantica TaxID=321895 RepID=A0A2V4T727_9BURK|nr:hypothetical protein C7410_115188 [Paraburkholderia silvatlantica]